MAASGLFGGLEVAEKPEVPPAVVNEVNRGEPWNVTVVRARLLSELGDLRLEKEGDRWFAIVADIEVTAPESRNDVSDIFSVSGVEGLLGDKPQHILKPQHIVAVRDASRVQYLNPNMPERIGFVWEQSGNAPIPTNVTITIYKKTYRASSLTDHMEWLDHEPRAQLEVPVEDKRSP
ncbi:hypothetical protein Pa4123_02840 [Phytohabitans aurantiacus]|uniref:Uncharacterized protein n=1 Tax=Phytohabitans aurantiacus TaxID=3016789 RepID=A0ABQ5QLE3_9ACTN|nr:hypothetical protein Pa4123_02840 [Phytohabitans aurantiacus]